MFFLWLNISMSLLFMFLNHPLSFGLVIIIQTISIALITGLMNFNFWYSYMIFLIMVGGMLVLFMYMTSIASNEKFKLSYSITTMISILIPSSLLISMAWKNMNLEINTKMEEISELTTFLMNKNSMMKYFNLPQSMIYTMMIIYLFIALIMVVKITNIKYGPLRQKI
uniref:NADH dehydrogenase subunit 6 n=1 Tax=Distenia punctulatoides TaxID=2980435 RepID=UPI0021D537C9|nr:NADH dehydrogenase subunit 6 [Distenia punctulatoides]UXG19101.1 NADH dehydrogenase subunit 6 [Distenia punctulatoides]